MKDAIDLPAKFGAGAVDTSAFGHHDHVRVIWSLIHTYGTLEAVRRFEAGLKRLTAAAGHPEKYHATITHAFGFLIGDRIAEQGALSWSEFVDSNADLFDWPNSALARMYPGDTLTTDPARRTFVLPSVVTRRPPDQR